MMSMQRLLQHPFRTWTLRSRLVLAMVAVLTVLGLAIVWRCRGNAGECLSRAR